MTVGRGFSLFLMIVFLVPARSFAAEEGSLPAARALRVDREPVLDGRLDEDFWREAPVQSGFAGIRALARPPQETEFRVVYTDEAVFFGITCYEREMDRLKTDALERDDPVWADDSVEVFLKPGNGYYYQFAVNSAAIQYDGRREARTGLTRQEMVEGLFWAGAWEAAAFTGPDRWSVEIRVPFAMLDPAGGFDRRWRINVGRNESRLGNSCWAPVEAGFHDLPRFGFLDGLEFEPGAYYPDVSGLEFPVFLVGLNSFDLAVPAREGSGSYDLRLSARQWRPGLLPERRTLAAEVEPAGGRLEASIEVPVARPGVMNELVFEIVEAPTGRSRALKTHLFRAPPPLDSSLDWTVYFSDEGAVIVDNLVRVAPDSLPATLSVSVYPSGPGQEPVYRADFPVTRPGPVPAPIPLSNLGPDGVYSIETRIESAGIEAYSDQVSFYYRSGRLY